MQSAEGREFDPPRSYASKFFLLFFCNPQDQNRLYEVLCAMICKSKLRGLHMLFREGFKKLDNILGGSIDRLTHCSAAKWAALGGNCGKYFDD
jgi:hypothetical protein